MAVNAFLAESALGWTEHVNSGAIDSQGRIEQLIGLGALASLDEVNRVVEGQLNNFARIREAFDLAVSTRVKSRLAYYKYGLGDNVSTDNSFGDSVTQRVMALTGSEDDAGFVTIVPTAGDLIMEPEVALANAVKKMISGTVHGSGDGHSKVAQPVVPEGRPRVPLQPQGGIDLSASYSSGSGLSGVTSPGGSSTTTGAASDEVDGFEPNFAIAVVGVADNFSGSTAISVGTPTLTGRGISWSLVAGPYAGFKAGTPDLHEQVMVFAGFGLLVDGTVTVDLGAANARALAVRVDNMAFEQVDHVTQTAVNYGASAGVTASASLSEPVVGLVVAVVHSAGDHTYDGTYIVTPNNAIQAGGVLSGLLFMVGNEAFPITYPVSLASIGQNLVWLVELSIIP